MADHDTASTPHLEERTQFLRLLAANPNHFGNLASSAFQPVLKITGNTNYEEVHCVGYNPKLNTLEATVHIKRPTGYLGGLCQPGSTEFVRFYVDAGAGWIDAGLAGFSAHDIPTGHDCAKASTKPLSYIVSLNYTPSRKACKTPVMPRVRAILSWQIAPPPNDHNWTPIWGNVRDQHIQIAPRSWFLSDVLDVVGKSVKQKLALPDELQEASLIPIPIPEPPPVEFAQLAKRYTAITGAAVKSADAAHEAKAGAVAVAAQNVEPHRFGVEHIAAALSASAFDQTTLSAKVAEWKGIGLDWSSAVSALGATNGNVSYEKLDCVGLDDSRHWLAATFKITRPAGYLGTLCERGSKEYVAFWADWDNDCNWTYVGTTSIDVHDISTIPADGLSYTALYPVAIDAYRKRCNTPVIARVRAVLSWHTPPSTVNPNTVPYWGNILDAHVQLTPGDGSNPLSPKIGILGGIGVSQIDTAGTGLTHAGPVKFAEHPAYFADGWGLGRQCPFGGYVNVQAARISGHKYRLWVRNITSGGLPQILTDPVQVVDQFGVPSDVSPDGSGFFFYLEPEQNIAGMLYNRWNPGTNDLWEIRLELATLFDVVLGSTVWMRLRMDNTAPDASLSIDGGECHKHTVGSTITGRFVARDTGYFGGFGLSTIPNTATTPSNAPTTATPPTAQTAAAPGDVWSLNLAAPVNMKPCGYVIHLAVADRTIVGSFPGSHNWATDDVGFCVVVAM